VTELRMLCSNLACLVANK